MSIINKFQPSLMLIKEFFIFTDTDVCPFTHPISEIFIVEAYRAVRYGVGGIDLLKWMLEFDHKHDPMTSQVVHMRLMCRILEKYKIIIKTVIP